jgi:hypothetical protein
MKIQIDNHWHKGLGTQLCAVSAFVHAGVKEIEVSDMAIYNALIENKNLLDLDITITHITNEALVNPLFPDDCFKLFSPYYKKPRANYKRKPYIGLAWADSAEHIFDQTDTNLNYPFNKLYPIENNVDIVKLIKRAGYDVVTLDSKDVSRTDKAWIIENLCDCVIGYEGGIAHLSHMLNVPYIMLPWRHGGGLEQLLHLDSTTYFLNSVHELLNWVNNDKHKLYDIINALNEGHGNNKFLSKERSIVIDENLGLTDDKGNVIPIWFNDSEKKFFKNNSGALKLGGNE